MTREEAIAKLDAIIWNEASEAERKALSTEGYHDHVDHPIRKIKTELGPTIQDLYDRFNWTRDELSAWFDKDADFINTMIYWE